MTWLILVGVFALAYKLGAPPWALVILAADVVAVCGQLWTSGKIGELHGQLEKLRRPINLHVQVGDEPERFIPIWQAEQGDDEEPAGGQG